MPCITRSKRWRLQKDAAAAANQNDRFMDEASTSTLRHPTTTITDDLVLLPVMTDETAIIIDDNLTEDPAIIVDENLSPHLSVSPNAVATIKSNLAANPAVPEVSAITNGEEVQAAQIALPQEIITIIDEDLVSSDGDLAFLLQMEETIAASSASSTAAPSTGALLNEEFAAAPDVFAKEIARLERKQVNPLQFGDDIQRTREDFELQSHDWKVASEISEIPNEERKATGDYYHRPHYLGSSSAMGGSDLGFSEEFSLYFKGLVVEIKNKPKLGAIGVAIFNSRNAVVFEVSKALILPETELKDEVAVLEAFVHGLEYALSLQLSSLVYSCVDFDVDHLLNANEEPKEAKVAELVHGALLLKRRFQQCNSSTPTNNKNNNTQTVLNLATSSIEKQAGKPFVELTLVKEICPICLEEVDSETMFEITNCLHRVCNSCLQKHIEHKVRERELPHCPEVVCSSYLDIDSCRRLLTRETCDVIDQLIKESTIPVTDKLYCPNPKCSNLMSKAEALANTGSKAKFSACEKCGTRFCIKCKSVRHARMSCNAYKKRRLSDSSSDDAKLKRLAGDEKWRQCPLCCHMVELVLGCNHICCRCGHQFCYLCGNEWKEKKATCSCSLWSEDKIIIGGGANLH